MNTKSQLGRKRRFWKWKAVMLHNNVNVLTAQNCTFKKWLKWQIIRYVYFTTISKMAMKRQFTKGDMQ